MTSRKASSYGSATSAPTFFRSATAAIVTEADRAHEQEIAVPTPSTLVDGAAGSSTQRTTPLFSADTPSRSPAPALGKLILARGLRVVKIWRRLRGRQRI